MKQLKDTKSLVAAALMAAFTCVATMVIQIPTPTLGYIHPGDSLVVLSGVILGPALGGLSAGIGSMMADLLSGYAIYAIPTFTIKAVSAIIAGFLFRRLRAVFRGNAYAAFLAAGLLAETNMVLGYFINKIIQTMFLAGSFQGGILSAGLANAVTTIWPNTVQGVVGVILGIALFPVLSQVPDIRAWIGMPRKKSA